MTPAPRAAANQGRWIARALLPLPRSEMAWATVLGVTKMTLSAVTVGSGRPALSHAYDPSADRWMTAPLLPARRANRRRRYRASGGKLPALGGHLDHNRRPDASVALYLRADLATDRAAAESGGR